MKFGNCLHCGTPLAWPQDLISTFTFPQDVVTVAALVDGSLNTRRHFCGKPNTFQVPLAGAWPARKQLVTNADLPEAMTNTVQAENWQLRRVANYNQLRAVVLDWISEETASYWALLRSDAYGELSVRELREKNGPLQLLAMATTRSGVLQVLVAAPDGSDVRVLDQEERAFYVELGVLITADQIRRVIRTLIVDGVTDGLAAELTKWVPTVCLDAPVLAALASHAQELFEENDLKTVIDAHVSLVANAVAHRLAGAENPREVELAYFLAQLDRIAQQDNVNMDERLWLSPSQWRQLVSEEVARAVAQAVFDAEPSGEGRLLAPGRLLGLIGRSDVALDVAAVIVRHAATSSADELLEVVVSQHTARTGEGTEEPADSWSQGSRLGWLVISTLSDSEPDELQGRISELTELLEQRRDSVAALAFHTAVVYDLNRRFRYSEALPSARYLVGHLSSDLPGDRVVQVLTECGNTARYQNDYDTALSAYEAAESINETLDAGRDERQHVLTRNRAIVLRDAGRFQEARSLFEELLAAESADADLDLKESYILLLTMTGRDDLALAQLNQVLAPADLSTFDRARFLQGRAAVLVKMGRDDDAVRDAMIAASLTPDNAVRRLLIDAVALEATPGKPELVEFCDNCAEHIRTTLDQATRQATGIAVSVAVISVLRHQRRSEWEAAREILEQTVETLRVLERGWPWQLTMAVGCYLHHREDPEAFSFLVDAVRDFDSALPLGVEAALALGLLADQSRDELCLTGLRAGIAACAAGRAEVEDLLAIFDLANGRDLTAAAARRCNVPTVDELPAALRRVQEQEQFDVITVLDCDDAVWLIVHPLDGPRRLVATGLDGIADAVRSLRLVEYANPTAPDGLDSRLKPWWTFAAGLAQVVRAELPAARELVVVPAASLVAAPLHAAGWPQSPLIAERAVSFSPNHRVLAGRLERGDSRKTGLGVVAVPRIEESVSTVESLSATVEALLALEPNCSVSSGVDATETQALDIMQTVRSAYLLCHGVHGGPRLGPGICVAAGGQLPPGSLPLASDPDLGHFILSWEDLVSLPSSPDLLVTIACSSGRTAIGRGGSRLGLEQGSVANASRYVVSPSWKVHQRSALAWVTSFAVAVHRDGVEPADACRQATLTLLQQFPHPYFWAPYLVTTALRGSTQ